MGRRAINEPISAFGVGQTDEDAELLREDPQRAWSTETMPGGVHCRPEGGLRGKWVKLGWAYNTTSSIPEEQLANEGRFDAQFPEIVLRGASALSPALGPYGPDGAFVAVALSGFGSMGACAAGDLCAAWIDGGPLPDFAARLSVRRYDDEASMAELLSRSDKGIL